ncbi:hypothetical protein L198_05641 [Cryptococcus wingfieldii CBS 7118]|uniref:Extracellular membrane protein CFEM domain-containing protein n=1 Tax=Cryptococcus wingfieldii CBS 7118 TaxID=1295528 RepID=A0A1E3IW47_9TREE|nr:hypothetical protein L198_05641 [Cryptococcus wingfieldii CBS 7118]ODN92844.1 hypothetical protein L198_05641 [Cryptococcus wingfieldii CBS 7118]
MSKILFIAATTAFAVVVKGQSAPNWQYIPSACADTCSQTVESAYLCETTYTSNTDVYGCFCNNYPTDASDCATCLTSNDAAALASLLTSTQTACPTAISECSFECAFDTCDSSDISCQCGAEYLENIYNCASCNTANGNTAATQISDFNSLQESCSNQNYTDADGTFTTNALPTINTDGYTAPTLTATGGGSAASDTAAVGVGATTAGTVTADATASAVADSDSESTASSTAAAADPSSSSSDDSSSSSSDESSSDSSSSEDSASSTAAGSSSTRTSSGSARASSTRSTSGSSTASSSDSSSSSSSSGAGMVSPAMGGVLAVAGAVLALL